jgi:indole-3-glycerol phosphate synthase
MRSSRPIDRLAGLLDSARQRVARARRDRPLAELERAAAGRKPRDFAGALRAAGRTNVIAEIKRASPSRGSIRPELDPAGLAGALAAAGAAALSVLTEPIGFGGSLEDLRTARAACALPVLRKDFIVDPWQVVESAAAGADAILLIVAALAPESLRELRAAAVGLGLDVLVEVHDAGELELALACGAMLIGVNSRDLRSFAIEPDRCAALAPRLPPDTIRVAESGLSSAAEIRRLRALGYHAFLIGEALMRAQDPAAQLREWIEDAG